MSTIPAATPSNPVATPPRVVRWARRGCCSTDTKMYALLIVGRVLQAAAVASVAGVAVATMSMGLVALCGLGLTVALAVLGTLCVDKSQKMDPFIPMLRPFVPGQPVGLRNSGNNCWLNAGLQVLAHVPAFQQRLRQSPELAQFLDSYAAARAGCQRVSPNIETHQIRQMLHRGLPQEISPGHVQQDGACTFEYLLSDPRALYQLESLLNGAVSAPESRSMIQIGLDRGVPIPGFDTLLSSSFEETTDTGQRRQFFFPQAPSDLLLHFKRFYVQDSVSGKIVENIETPERFQFPSRFVRSGENATYQCDAFVLHTGSDGEGGHYVAYIKVGSTWWCCDDTTVYEVAVGAAHAAMKQSYIMHYAKV